MRFAILLRSGNGGVGAVVAAAVVAAMVPLRMILCLQIVCFPCFLKRRNGQRDGPTDGPTDLRTDPLIEMQGRI